jgi:hypothetical protein
MHMPLCDTHSVAFAQMVARLLPKPAAAALMVVPSLVLSSATFDAFVGLPTLRLLGVGIDEDSDMATATSVKAQIDVRRSIYERAREGESLPFDIACDDHHLSVIILAGKDLRLELRRREPRRPWLLVQHAVVYRNCF